MLIDSTLREGAQMFGVYFSDAQRRDILSGLILGGIDEVEIGWAGQDGLEDLLRHGRKADQAEQTRLTVWSPLRMLDLDRMAAMDVRRIQFGVPVSDAHIEHRLGTDREGLLLRLENILRRATELEISFVGVGLEDVSRADRDFALQVVRVVEECGGRRIRLSDTVGLLTPLETAELMRWFTDRTELAIDSTAMTTSAWPRPTPSPPWPWGPKAWMCPCWESENGPGSRPWKRSPVT